jgi:hypothetical protein
MQMNPNSNVLDSGLLKHYQVNTIPQKQMAVSYLYHDRIIPMQTNCI